MDISRRKFLTRAATLPAAAAAAAAAAAVPEEAQALQRDAKHLPAEAIGLLYDSTLCVGCKACVTACKEINHLSPITGGVQPGWNDGTWDAAEDLSAKTWNIIKVYQNGTGATKDAEVDGHAFVKRQCLHCADPSCVSCCPVSANTKDGLSGIVKHNADRCIGCRYCVFACPFGIPKYDYNDAFGEIHKCQLCAPRLAEGQLPGCADVCPTGATLFGRTADLKKEAERRLALKPGDAFVAPRGDLARTLGGDRPGHETAAKTYRPHVYGATEVGGTQCLMLSAVDFGKLGMPTGLPDHSHASESEGIQHTLYKGMAAPAALLAGLVYLAKRNAGGDEDGDKHG
ncbi:MAG TPA: hydrogenase 2 operon protein HybA [Azospirillaceae bacterium]|nr:hydrogenase 2 operon protein HybA [Azospirillaceae bacterium]